MKTIIATVQHVIMIGCAFMRQLQLAMTVEELKVKTETGQRQAARKFVEQWTFRRGSEKGEDQQFWNMLLRDVLATSSNFKLYAKQPRLFLV